jgi:serine/threonine-protein kinase
MHPVDDPSYRVLREIWPPGTVIKGDYVIEERLGGGGFGAVYRASHRFLGTLHVIKRMHEQYASDPEYVRKFVNEGRAVRRLKGCPYIVEVEHMTQTDDGHLILIMEHIDGVELSKVMPPERIVSVHEAIEYGRQIALALQAAHEQRLIHRDIKPPNILYTWNAKTGQPLLKLIDFGIAADHASPGTASTAAMRPGSLGYAAPEQWMQVGRDLDGRADLYSLGVLLYAMLCSRMPYPRAETGTEVIAWLTRVTQGPPPAPPFELRADVPRSLSDLILRMLAVQPAGRPRDAAEVAAKLTALQGGSAVAPPLPPPPPAVETERLFVERRDTAKLAPLPPPPPPPTPVSNKWFWIAFGTVLAGGLGWTFWPKTQPAKAEVPNVVLGGLTYVRIPAGEFQMGCVDPNADGPCDADEKPVRTVRIGKPFYLGQTEVTVGAYRAYLKDPAALAKLANEPANYPVSNATWREAAEYCAAVASRLPTEAEWEYAARAGRPGKHYGRLGDIAWNSANAQATVHPVGLLQPNAWRLYDMLGNALEWTADWWGRYPAEDQTDPTGPASGEGKAMRGGAFYSALANVRIASRLRYEPDRAFGGFRCLAVAAH